MMTTFRPFEVLDQETVVQELMHRNPKAVAYFCRTDVLKVMVELVSVDSTYKVSPDQVSIPRLRAFMRPDNFK